MYLVKMQLHHGISFTSENKSNISSGIVHSDTLFSALVNQFVLLKHVNITEFDFQNPPFRISSVFPFFGSTFYLPKPMGVSSLFMTTLKDFSFLPLPFIVSLASGDLKSISINQELEDSKNLIYSFRIPRTTVDRITAVANPYRPESWYIRDGGGLYFLLDVHNDSFMPVLETCIQLLGLNGLGSDRSTGHGIFTPEIILLDKTSEWTSLFNMKEYKNSLYYSLSLCWPRDNNEAGSAKYYRILSRKGWISSTSTFKQIKRRECKMFAEGSLFDTYVTGGVADVTPGNFTDHPVYRYGLGMMIALKRSSLLNE